MTELSYWEKKDKDVVHEDVSLAFASLNLGQEYVVDEHCRVFKKSVFIGYLVPYDWNDGVPSEKPALRLAQENLDEPYYRWHNRRDVVADAFLS